MSNVLLPSDRSGIPCDYKRRMRGSFVDEDGVRHYVNAIVVSGMHEVVDAWETECLDHHWNEWVPKMSPHKATCIACLAYLEPAP